MNESDPLDQIQATFEAHLAAMVEQHKQTIALAQFNLLHKLRAEQQTPLTLCQSFLLQATAWVQQRLIRRDSQDRPLPDDDTAQLSNEDAVVIVDAEYRVVES